MIKNGEFGNRLHDILSCYRLAVRPLEHDWGQRPDLEAVERELAANSGIRWICIVYHETRTGMLNPVGRLGDLAQKYGLRLFVDCVSAIGGRTSIWSVTTSMLPLAWPIRRLAA